MFMSTLDELCSLSLLGSLLVWDFLDLLFCLPGEQYLHCLARLPILFVQRGQVLTPLLVALMSSNLKYSSITMSATAISLWGKNSTSSLVTVKSPKSHLTQSYVTQNKSYKCMSPEILSYVVWNFIKCLLGFSMTSKHQSSKANHPWHYLLPSITLADLSENRSLLQQVEEVMAFDMWLVDFDPFCVLLCLRIHRLWP